MAEPLAEVRRLVYRLAKLLKDPRPALFSWQGIYNSTMQELVDLWTHSNTPDLVETDPRGEVQDQFEKNLTLDLTDFEEAENDEQRRLILRRLGLPDR